MSQSIVSGAMSADITNGAIVDVRGQKKVFVYCSWGATGNPVGKWGIKAGASSARMVDLGFIDGGNFLFNGAQPSGAGAGSIVTDFVTGANFLQVYYTFTSGGAANTSGSADVSKVGDA